MGQGLTECRDNANLGGNGAKDRIVFHPQLKNDGHLGDKVQVVVDQRILNVKVLETGQRSEFHGDRAVVKVSSHDELTETCQTSKRLTL